MKNRDLASLLPDTRIERVIRKYRLGEEPSEVDEWAHVSPEQRLKESIALWRRHIRWVHGSEPEFERVLVVARQA